jgi:hypothetical protein
MNGTRTGLGWGARLLIALVLIVIGAAAATWGLAHYQPAARFLGIVPAQQPVLLTPRPVVMNPQPAVQQQPSGQQDVQEPVQDEKIESLETRVASVEHATARAEGSAGRADALVVAFAARRAIDRGVALGPELRRGGPDDSWWTNFRRELGEMVEIHSASRPAASLEARYNRAARHLDGGDVDQALAETMRLPGASRAGDWIGKARRYIAAHRALDEIESAALMPQPAALR